MSIASVAEYLERLRWSYAVVSKREKGVLLDEGCATLRYHRKAAIRALTRATRWRWGRLALGLAGERLCPRQAPGALPGRVGRRPRTLWGVVADEIESAILARLAVLAASRDLLDDLVCATNTRPQRQPPAFGKRRKALLRELSDVKGQQDRLLSNWDELKATAARTLLTEKLNGLVEREHQLEAATAEIDTAVSTVQATRIDPTVVREALSRINEIYQHLQPMSRRSCSD